MKSCTPIKLSQIALIVGSLSACATTVEVHKPMPCEGVPAHRVKFNSEEKASISDSVERKISEIMAIYKARIRAQCKAVNAHNEAHL